MIGELLRRWILGDADALVVAHRARTQVEADLLAAVLREAGFRVLVRRRGVPGYEGVFEAARGVWADLLVARSDAHRARALVAKFLESPVEDASGSGQS
ncbi:MAG: hypothetical protein QN163_02170 [Armatimonadota bacterium]|nr:hypothetical protein [Armatimonadota bacterium]MDR5696269.1 hypothetical protein [Armatimonadota bacterium]